MKKVYVVISVVIIALIAFPAGYIILSQPSSPSQEGPYGTPTSTDGETLKYKTASFIDTEGIGTKAFTMLIPSDWQSEGSITWIYDNPAMPVAGEFRTWNPNGKEEFHLFPNQAFFWSNNPMIEQTFPPGSKYFGATVKTPLDPIEALKEIALNKFRSNVDNLQVVSEENLTNVAASFQTGTDQATGVVTSAEAGKIRVEYTLNGVQMEEEFYCVIQSQDIPVPTIYGTTHNINWYMTYLESFLAEKGKLDTDAKTFQTISYFARTDINWLNKYTQVVNYLIQRQIQQIQNLGQLSSIVSQTSNDISDANYDAWQRDQNIKDKLADDFSNSILGVQSYNNPLNGSSVELPSGYSNVWTNSLGEYILSDIPSYNPNLDSNLNWQQMSP